MKTKFIFPIIFFFITLLSFSQSQKEKREKVKALKVAYITEKLELSSEEAQKFWPIYNSFDEDQSELRHNKMREILNRFEPENVAKLSEKEALILLVQMEKIEENLLNLKKKFIKDLQEIMSAKKIIKLRKAEEDFNRELLKQMRDKKNN